MQIKRKHITWAAAVVVLGAFGALLLRPEKLDVEWGIAARGPFRVVTEADAVTRARSRYVIAAPVTGRVERLTLRAGDSVRVGSVVARIAPAPLDPLALEQARSRLTIANASHAEAEARFHQAQTALTLANRDARRAVALEAAGGLSTQQREAAESDVALRADELRAAESRLTAADAELRAATSALAGNQPGAPLVSVISPVRGQVLRVPEQSERVTGAGAVLLELANPGDVEVVVNMLSSDAVRVPPAADVELEGWGGDSILRGRVKYIEPAATTHVSALGVDEQRVDAIVTPVTSLTSLGDGYRLTARIILWQGRDILSVPSSAVFKSGDEWRLFVAQDGRARARTVTLGQRSDAAVEIRSGVDAGETVILFPSDRIKDGARIALR